MRQAVGNEAVAHGAGRGVEHTHRSGGSFLFRKVIDNGQGAGDPPDKFAVAAGVLALLGGALALWRLDRQSVGKLSAIAWAAMFGALVAIVSLG